MTIPFDSIIVLGPTASGKTQLGVSLAQHLQGSIISADSRQVYRGMDLGTGKDLEEYGETPYFLIDILPAGQTYNLFQFLTDYKRVYAEIKQEKSLPIIVGGTGLYLDGIVFGYQLKEVPMNDELRAELAELTLERLQDRLISTGAELHNETDLHSRTRLVRAIEIAEAETHEHTRLDLPVLNPLILGIQWDPGVLRQRIALRLKQRMQAGMIEEARNLIKSGVTYDQLDYYGLEYRFLARYLKGELNRNDMTQKLNSAICQFAKRQRTWFRRMERKGAVIHWLQPGAQSVTKALSLFKSGKRQSHL